MKIRTDFVSNSSSCSFVIETDMLRFNKVTSIFSEVEIPYTFENEIEVYLHSKNKNFNKLKCLLHELEYINDGVYTKSYSEYMINNPDEIHWNDFRITFPQLCNLPSDAYQYIDMVTFSSDDYGFGRIYLKMLYDFYDMNGCKPDSGDTERSFNTHEDDSFFKLLTKKVEI